MVNKKRVSRTDQRLQPGVGFNIAFALSTVRAVIFANSTMRTVKVARADFDLLLLGERIPCLDKKNMFVCISKHPNKTCTNN